MYERMTDLTLRLIAAALVVGFIAVFIPSLFGGPVIGGAVVGVLWGLGDDD